MIVPIWAVFALARVCNGLTLPISNTISNPQSSNSTDAFLPIPNNLSFTGHHKDSFEVPGTDPIIKGVVAWPMPRFTFSSIVMEGCIKLLIRSLQNWPGDTMIIAPEWTECQPLEITLWPLDTHATAAPITNAEGVAVLTALINFIAESGSYGNLYIYVFRGVVNIATINLAVIMPSNVGGNVTTSDNVTNDTNLNPPSIASSNTSDSLSNSDQFIVPNTSPQLKGLVAWPGPRFILEKDPVTKVVRALAARMKAKPIYDIVPGPENELNLPLSLTLFPLHNTGQSDFMTYWEAAIVLTFFNQYMAHQGSYGNFYVYIFRDTDCIGTIKLESYQITSNSTSDTSQVSVT